MIHEGDKIKILMDEEKGLCKKLQDELLDSTNLAKGTIFDNIKKINLRMTEKLKKRIDLRTVSALDEEEEAQLMDGEYDRFSIFEAKIEQCIEQFNKLNINHQDELGFQKQLLQDEFEKKIMKFEFKLDDTFEQLKLYS